MRAWLWVAVALAGCSDDYEVDVRLTPTEMQWIVWGSTCDIADLPAPGNCDGGGDGGHASPCQQATCATHGQLELGGQVVKDLGDGNTGVVENPPAADELVLTGCASEIHVALPTTLPAGPAITSFVGTHVEWTVTPPLDRVTVNYGTPFTWSTCAVSPETTSYDLGDPHENWAKVGAWAPLVTTSISLGTAHVRAGAVTMGTAN